MSDLSQNGTEERQPANIGSLEFHPQPGQLERDATRRTLPALARRFFGSVDEAAVLNISEDVLRHMRAISVELQPRLTVDGYSCDARTVERLAAMLKLQRMLTLYRRRS